MKKIFKSKSSKKSASSSSLGATNNAENGGYDVKEKDLPKLHKAAWLGDINKVKQLAKKAADYNQLDKENRTPLHLACSQGHKDVVEHLMSNKAKLNLCDNHNRSPLMKAVQADCEDIVVILLKHKADPNLVDKDSNTALHLASKAGSVSIAALLLDSGALTNASNKDGRSPLHLATNEKHDEMVELLLHRNADVNAVDNQNRTGLMLACLTDQIGMVRLFLDHKASTDIKDHKGWTANDHAIMGGYHGCSHLIDEYQASNRPRSRGTSRPGTGMFSSGTVDSDSFGYALGGPALDYGDDEDDEISADKMSNGEDSWAVSASETEEPAKPVHKKAVVPKLTKFMPESDTESVKSHGVGAKNASRSGIPRAVSRESLKSATSIKNDKQTSKIPRLSPANPDHTSVTSKKATKDSKQHVPKSGFGYGPPSDQISPMSTPRGSMTSLGDSEWDDDDVLAALEGIPPQKDMRTPIAEEEEDDTVTPVLASKSKGGKLTENDKKMRKDVLSKLGMSDVDDEDEESEQFSEKAPSIEQRGSTLKKKAESVSKATKNDTPRSVPDDMFDDDWDSGDDDMLPSHTSDNKGHAPPATRTNDGGGRAQGTPDKMTGIQDDGEDDWDTDDEEEEESEWEKENRRQEGKGSKANRKDNEEDEEILRQEQWDKEMKEREERMKREADEEIQKEKGEKERQQKHNERFRKEEERKRLEKQKMEDELKEKEELERLQREERKLEKQRQEEQRIEEEREKEERRKDEERRERQRKEEERRVQEEKEEYRKQQENIKRERGRVLEEEELAKKRIHDLEKAAEIKRKEELEKQKQLDKEAEKKRVEEERKLKEIKSEFERKQMDERQKLQRMKREEEERLEAVRIAEEEKRISEEKKLEEMKKKLEHDHQLKEEERKEDLRKLEIERQKLEEERVRQENEWKKNEKERQAHAKKLEEEAKRREQERKIEEEEKIQAEKKRQDEERQQLEKQKKMLELEKEEMERKREDETRRLREEFEHQQKEQKRQLEEEKLRFEEERLAMEKRLQEERENLKKVASGKMTEEKYIEQERLRVEEEKRRFEEQRMEFERKRIENMEKEDELRRAADDLRRNEEEKVKAEKKILEDERREFERQKLELENMKRDRESMGSRTGDRNLLQYQRSLEERLAYEDAGDFVNTDIKNRNVTNNGAADGADGDDEFDEMLSQLEDEAEMMLKKQTHPSSTSALEQRPKMNRSKDSETQSAGNLGGGRMSEGAIPYKPANATFSLDSYSSMIIHPTVKSFQPAWKNVLDEHDGLSFTSSEGGDSMDDVADTVIQPPYFASTPLPHLNTSVNANTSHEGALRMHAALRDHKRIVEKERTGRVNAENQSKALQSENKELHRQKAELIRTKNELEQQLVELESKIRDLEFRLGQEVEKRHNLQIILEKTREQLARKEELYSIEIDARQKTELNSRNTSLELRTVQNNIKQLEEECDDLRKQLLQERNTRALHEEFNYDISKKHEVMKERKENKEDDKAVQKTYFEKAEIINRLELADENRKTALSTNDKLKDELYILKVEYERQKIKYKDSHGLLASENEELSHKIDQLKNDIHVNDEALAHATYTFNTQLAAVKTENVRLYSEIEKDRSEKGKLISELNSISNRLETTSRELEKSQQARTELEKAMQRERDEAQQMRIKREHEMITSKDATQANAVRLGSAETRVISMENEIHVTQSTLMERNNQLMALQRELDQRINKLQMQDVLLQREKEEKLRLGAKLETATERLNEAQNDVADWKKSLEKAHSEKHLKDRETTDVTDKLNETLHTLRADKDRAQVLLEEKNENLSQTISQLKNELQERNQTGSLKDQDAKALQQNLMDTTTKLSVAEAHLHHAFDTHEAIVREKNLLMQQLEQKEEKLILSGRDRDTLIAKIEQLEEKLSHAEKSKFEASEQLSTAKFAVQQKAELDDRLREVETKNARLEVMLKQESARCETLEKNLQEAHKMQTGMEAIVNNLNSANLHMEGRLTDEAAARSVFAKEAEEHKDLWETEVKSRSSLGVKMAQLQRSRAGVVEQVEDEKRRTRKMAELKRVVEGKLENETQRYRQLEQEMNTTKMKLKLAKKKLKDLEMPELRINSIKSDFERERINMDATVASLRRQLEDVSQQLEQENKLRSEVEVINRQLQRDASSVKIIGKGKEKLEKSKKRLEEELHVLKGALHQDFIEKGELERYKQELDAKARIEINEKLDQVNAYLEEQAQAREKLEQLRNSNEEDMRKELDNTITNQKAELVRIRSTYHDIQTQKDTVQAEATRFKELYERELKSKEKMSRDLENERDRSTNYESKLNFERQRNQHLKEASISPTSPILKRKPRNDIEIDSFTEKVWSELDKSISRHLRSASMEIGPNIGEVRENLANGLDGSRRANVRQQNNQYMDTLRRNYFV